MYIRMSHASKYVESISAINMHTCKIYTRLFIEVHTCTILTIIIVTPWSFSVHNCAMLYHFIVHCKKLVGKRPSILVARFFFTLLLIVINYY